jgi:hypothetical protein
MSPGLDVSEAVCPEYPSRDAGCSPESERRRFERPGVWAYLPLSTQTPVSRVSTDPVSESNPTPSAKAKVWEDFYRDVNRLTSTAVAYWSAMLFVAGVLIFLWFARSRGPDHPLYGLLVAAWTWGLGPGVAVPVMLRLPPRWFRVPAGERVLHRMLGIGVFAWVLERSGYNRRLVHPQWGFSMNRAGVPSRALAARGGASAHGAGFVIHVVLAGAALFTGYPWGAVWILLPGVVLHLYPVLLQRSITLRLQPLLDRLGARP